MTEDRRILRMLHVSALVLLALLAVFTRVRAAATLELTNDEMHHLESWRNRYGTDDIYPLFLRRLESSQILTPRQFELVRRIYHSSPLVQRGLIVLVDPQPPLYPIMAEMIQAATDSSLVALRIPSLVASLLAIALIYLVGREWKDVTLGLWLAVLLTIGAVPQHFGGIGRPYAMAQCALIFAIYVFLRQRKAGSRSMRPFLASALLAQALQWMAWAAIGPLVVDEIIRRRRAGTPWKRLVAEGWWYLLLSTLLLVYMGVQLQNPTVANQGGLRSPAAVWNDFAVASPLGHVGGFSDLWLHVGGAMFLALVFAGAGWAMTHARSLHPGTYALLGALAASVFAAVFIGSAVRFMMTYHVMPILFAGLAAYLLSRTRLAATVTALLVLLTVGGLGAVWPEDEYRRIDHTGIPYSPVARTLAEQLGPDDAWVTYPANIGNNLYRFGPFPEPAMPVSDEELAELIQQRDGSGDLFVLTIPRLQEKIPELRDAEPKWWFLDRYVLVKLSDP